MKKNLSKKTNKKTKTLSYEEKREMHNNVRKSSYNTDPEYRAKVMKSNRANHRKNGVVLGQKQMNTISNLDKLSEFGEMRDVKQGRKTVPMLCFTSEELAAVLNIHKMHLYRWYSKKQLQRPTLVSVKEGTDITVLVYTESQVLSIATILQEHYNEFCYFRHDHYDTVAKLKTIFN